MKLVLIGDGESLHLLKWARALAAHPADITLYAASTRGFLPGFDNNALLPAAHRLALYTRPRPGGGNAAVVATLPRLSRWLRAIAPDWLHAHYLTSHGTLAWLAQRVGRVPGRIVASAWGSDVLVTPQHSAVARGLLRRVLAASALATSDSQHMAQRMQAYGAHNVMVFPFGLEAMPPAVDEGRKEPWLFYTNRALEPLYAPLRVLDTFAQVAAHRANARLVIANDGSMVADVAAAVAARGLRDKVQMVGRLDEPAQTAWLQRARWFFSLPRSDSVAVSLLEAMAQGCIPIVSDLPANRELVRHGDNGLVIDEKDVSSTLALLDAACAGAADTARNNRRWVAQHALFAPAVHSFVERLLAIHGDAHARR